MPTTNMLTKIPITVAVRVPKELLPTVRDMVARYEADHPAETAASQAWLNRKVGWAGEFPARLGRRAGPPTDCRGAGRRGGAGRRRRRLQTRRPYFDADSRRIGVCRGGADCRAGGGNGGSGLAGFADGRPRRGIAWVGVGESGVGGADGGVGLRGRWDGCEVVKRWSESGALCRPVL